MLGSRSETKPMFNSFPSKKCISLNVKCTRALLKEDRSGRLRSGRRLLSPNGSETGNDRELDRQSSQSDVQALKDGRSILSESDSQLQIHPTFGKAERIVAK